MSIVILEQIECKDKWKSDHRIYNIQWVTPNGNRMLLKVTIDECWFLMNKTTQRRKKYAYLIYAFQIGSVD